MEKVQRKSDSRSLETPEGEEEGLFLNLTVIFKIIPTCRQLIDIWSALKYAFPHNRVSCRGDLI